MNSAATTTPTASTETPQVGISLRNLYKIFGPTPEKFIDAVRAGMTKQELLDKHNHVLGLRDVLAADRHRCAGHPHYPDDLGEVLAAQVQPIDAQPLLLVHGRKLFLQLNLRLVADLGHVLR